MSLSLGIPLSLISCSAFLRLNSYGKHLLDRKEILNSNFVGFSAIVFIIGSLLYIYSGNYIWLSVIAFGFTMMVPFSNMFLPSKYKHSFLIYTLFMLSIGISSISITFITGELFNGFTTIYLLGFIGFL